MKMCCLIGNKAWHTATVIKPKKKRPADANSLAASVLADAIRESENGPVKPKRKRKKAR